MALSMRAGLRSVYSIAVAHRKNALRRVSRAACVVSASRLALSSALGAQDPRHSSRAAGVTSLTLTAPTPFAHLCMRRVVDRYASTDVSPGDFIDRKSVVEGQSVEPGS